MSAAMEIMLFGFGGTALNKLRERASEPAGDFGIVQWRSGFRATDNCSEAH